MQGGAYAFTFIWETLPTHSCKEFLGKNPGPESFGLAIFPEADSPVTTANFLASARSPDPRLTQWAAILRQSAA